MFSVLQNMTHNHPKIMARNYKWRKEKTKKREFLELSFTEVVLDSPKFQKVCLCNYAFRTYICMHCIAIFIQGVGFLRGGRPSFSRFWDKINVIGAFIYYNLVFKCFVSKSVFGAGAELL